MRRGFPFVSKLLSSIRRFRRHEKGVTAIEFALLAPPFLAVFFATFQQAIFMFAQQSLENALSRSARTILTGQMQNARTTAAQFRTNVCADLVAFIDCESDLRIDLRVVSNFAGGVPPIPATMDDLDPSKMQFTPGAPGQIVVLRAMAPYPMYAAYLSSDGRTLQNGDQLLMACLSFRIEPYVSTAAAASGSGG